MMHCATKKIPLTIGYDRQCEHQLLFFLNNSFVRTKYIYATLGTGCVCVGIEDVQAKIIDFFLLMN